MIESGKFYKTATERNAIRVYRKKYYKRREKSALIGRIEKGFMEHVSVRALLVISNRTQMKKGLSKRGKIMVSITDIQGEMELQENLDRSITIKALSRERVKDELVFSEATGLEVHMHSQEASRDLRSVSPLCYQRAVRGSRILL